MIYLKLHDRMGNIMFMIAAALSVSEHLVVYCDNEKDENYAKRFLSDFNLPIKIINRNNVPQCKEYNYHSPIVYKPIPYNTSGGILRINGYFQSYKYFNPSLPLKLFRPPESIKVEIEKQYGCFLKNNETVCIHVRRGDYLLYPERFAFVGLRYIKNAMRHFSHQAKFVFTSDDIEWCKKHFHGNNIFFSEGNSPIFDLYLASFCKHNIISNSTFSWWGAFLNTNYNKKVIYPSRWYGPVLAQEANEKKGDLIPPGWIKEKCYWDNFGVFCKAYFIFMKCNWRRWLHLPKKR